VLCARERILLVAGGLEAHDEAALHPLAHRLAPALKHICTRTRLEEALSASSTPLSGRYLVRFSASGSAPPPPRIVWTTPIGFAGRLAMRRESATSLETLAACPLAWALRHVAGLRPGQARAIPDENQLIGNLAHALKVATIDRFQAGQADVILFSLVAGAGMAQGGRRRKLNGCRRSGRAHSTASRAADQKRRNWSPAL
jgi:hypothetical protein